MSEGARYSFGARDRSGVVVGLRVGQLAVLASGAGAAMLLMLASHGSFPVGALAAATLLVAVGCAVLPVGGRAVDEWCPVLLRWMLSGRAWRSTAPAEGELVTARELLVDPQPSLPPTLRGVTILSVRIAGGACIGVVRDPRRRTFTAVIRVRGSSYALLSDREKSVQLAAWGTALSSLAYAGTPVASLQVVVRSVAEDPDGMARYLDQAGHDDAGSSLRASYAGLVDAAAPVTQAQEVFVALTISERRAGRAIAAAGGHDGGAITVLLRVLTQMQTQLGRAHIHVDGVLPPRLLALVLREAWDPTAAHSLRRRSARDLATAGTALHGAGPQSTMSSWRHLITDGGCAHATYWISEWPRIEVGPNFLVPLLLQSAVGLTFAVTMAPVDPRRAQRDLEAAQTAHRSDEMLREKHGFRTTVSNRRQAESIEDREREFVDGHADYRFSGYLTVSAASVDALDAACSDVEQQARNCRLDVRRMDGEHDLAFTYTLPLGRGLS
ncbi:MAG: hypothetical protein JF886_14250 [Candidatus Dormibacteraeota bacterium]|uniref:PrgI family protein n=1 Tax=Candidatus Aeolococcus gillhamiae TaxID=3127015 RepID=A0A934JZW4_9BACT|nr:hypothetical protein [Candidatus Dormibacteraeota bacterium]